MKRTVVVLGCGRVGATIAKDLARDTDIEVVGLDNDEERLDGLSGEPNTSTQKVDLRDEGAIKKSIKDADLVIGAVPGVMGFGVLKAVIECGKSICDISFMPEDFLELDPLAMKNKVTAVVDCGVAPGLTNMVVGHVHAQLDITHRVDICAGGLPKVRQWPYEYKAPFSPGDVIEEYTRPARLVEYGQVVSKPALSDPELIDFPEVGTLEAFNTDGLRSLLKTIKAQHMRERTLRYPGHIHLIRVLRDTGFFDKIHVDVGGTKIRPLDVTEKLLFPLWSFEENEEEFTVVRVEVEGEKDKKHLRYTYDLYDETDLETNTSSMARATGFPCAIVARMMLRGDLKKPGVFPPELLTLDAGMLDHMVSELSARGVVLTSEVAELSPNLP